MMDPHGYEAGLIKRFDFRCLICDWALEGKWEYEITFESTKKDAGALFIWK